MDNNIATNETQEFYTVAEVAERLHLSYASTRILVKDEPDVLAYGTGKKNKMRRVPHEVLLRIMKRHANPAKSVDPARLRKAG